MANLKELKALITLAGKIDPSFQAAMLKASGESLKRSNNLKKAGQGMNDISTIAKGTFLGGLAANAVSRITSNVWELGKGSIRLASDLTEVQNVVDTSFGKSADQINVWSKTALNAYGLSELQAKQYSGTIGAMLKSSGLSGDAMLKMSKNITALSGDFSSFYNLQQEAAFEKIRSGISGETEPLKQLGINMSVANLEAYALSKGITTSYNDMDQASQTLLRYNYLMDKSKNAQGDFARTQGNFANQQRLFDANLQQFSATIAEKALPYLTQFLQKGNDFMMKFDIAGAAEKAGYWFGLFGNSIKWVYDHLNVLIPVLSGVVFSITAFKVVGTVTGLIDAWKASTFAMTLAQKGLNIALRANPVGLIITELGLLVGAVVYARENWDSLSLKATTMWLSIKTQFTDGANYVIGKINLLIDALNHIAGVDIGKITMVGYDVLSRMGHFRALEAQAYARGGIATRPSIFGEAGPEMAIPLERSARSLGLLQQTARFLGVGLIGLPKTTETPEVIKTPKLELGWLRPQVANNQQVGRVNQPEINITYAPVIQVGSPNVKQALDVSFEQFKDWVEEYFEGKVRVSLG